MDGVKQDRSLFAMIRHTHHCHPEDVLSAYSDNAAVMTGFPAGRFFPDPADGGRPPFEVYQRALASDLYEEVQSIKSLRILRKL